MTPKPGDALAVQQKSPQSSFMGDNRFGIYFRFQEWFRVKQHVSQIKDHSVAQKHGPDFDPVKIEHGPG